MRQSPSSDVRFRRLFDEHEAAMREYCSRRLEMNEANDAVAEVFLVAWRKIHELPAGQDELPWLYGVARNVVRNVERSRRRRVRLGAKLDATAPLSASGPEQQVVRRVEDRLVLQAMSSLKLDDRELLRLRTWEELSRSELATVLGITAEAVDMRLKRAIKRMAGALRSAGYIHELSTRPRAVEEGGAR